MLSYLWSLLGYGKHEETVKKDINVDVNKIITMPVFEIDTQETICTETSNTKEKLQPVLPSVPVIPLPFHLENKNKIKTKKLYKKSHKQKTL
jgi:hypothetical protein